MGYYFKQYKIISLILLSIIVSKINSEITFKYPIALSLRSDNIFVVDQLGVNVYNPSLTYLVKNVYNFSEEDKITNDEAFSKVIIRRHKNFVLGLINDKIYLFNEEGNLLFRNDTKLVSGQSPKQYTIVGRGEEYRYYLYYLIGYFDSENHLILLFYEYYSIKNKNTLLSFYNYSNHEYTYNGQNYYYSFKNQGLSCEYLTINNYDIFTCFYVVSDSNDKNLLIPGFYEDKGDSLEKIYSEYYPYLEIDDIKFIKSESYSDYRSDLVCFVTENKLAKCSIFRINSMASADFYSTVTFPKQCKNELYASTIGYIYENSFLYFLCNYDVGGGIQAKIYDPDYDSPSFTYEQFVPCQEIHGHSILYLENNYYILSDVKCSKTKFPFIEIDGTLEFIEETDYSSIVIIEEEKEEELEEETKEEEKEEELEEETKEEETEELECEENCSKCDRNSMTKNLCIKCNKLNGYYPLNPFSSKSLIGYIECVNNDTKPRNFYFDVENEDYELCYERCATCDYKGDHNEHNCTSCDEGYMKNPDYENSTFCIPNCKYYYYQSNGQYKCTTSLECPKDYEYLIKNKTKCIDNCTKDNTYKYIYNGECFAKCPDETQYDSNDNICKDVKNNKCHLSENEYNNLAQNISDSDIEKLVKSYAIFFKDTDDHVSIYKNNIYTITLYKNGYCISDLDLKIPEINFGECEEKVKNTYHIEENLIIAIVDKKIEGSNCHELMRYSMYTPTEGAKLPADELCENTKIIMQENMKDKFRSNVDYESIADLLKQNIDALDLSSDFYNDLCYHYESNFNKDVPLKDRVLIYFPNITLCDKSCEVVGINKTHDPFKAICECKYNGNKGNNILSNNILYQSQIGQIEEIINNVNIAVITCYKYIFIYKYFITCTGGFIILSLIILQIIFMIIFYYKDLYQIKKYIFIITNKFISYLKSNKNNNINSYSNSLLDNNITKKNPPKRHFIRRASLDNFKEKKNIRVYKPKGKTAKHLVISPQLNEKMLNELEKNINKNNDENIIKNDSLELNKENIKIHKKKKTGRKRKKSFKSPKKNSNTNVDYSNNISKETVRYKLSNDNLNQPTLILASIKDDLDINIVEYIKTDVDELDYDDALKKDDRKFCEYLGEKIRTRQIILNTFCLVEQLKPRPIKIMLFILQIDLYLFVNGLFFNEEYISKIFHLEKDTFYEKFQRFIGNFFYTAIVGVIVSYIIECFFIEEKKIKGILKREKENILVLKYEITQVIKSIENRYLYFIMISFIITIFTWLHISCFNYVYPHTKKEWIIFSLIIIILMQILSILGCLLESIIRFLSFKCKNEKLFRLSLLLS